MEHFSFSFRIIILAALVMSSPAVNAAGKRLKYPPARESGQVDEYHGVKVADPYRWLENTDSKETKKWIEQENKLTFSYLEKIPERAGIKSRLTQLWNYERFGVPFKEGGKYFFTRNDGLQNQSVLYLLEKLDGVPAVVIDPNALTKDGTVALKGYAPSRDGRFLAYGLSASGSDWEEWKVMDLSSKTDTADVLKWVKFSGASWDHDGKGVYYCRYAKPNETSKMQGSNYDQKLYYHKLGEAQDKDELIYYNKDKREWMYQGTVTDDGKFLIITIHQSTAPKRAVFYKDLTNKDSTVVKLLEKFDAAYDFLGNDGSLFWFETDLDAPRGKVIGIDLNKPEKENWKTIIPEHEHTLRGVSLLGGKFIAHYMRDAKSEVRVFSLTGEPAGKVELPGLGTVGGFGGRQDDKETFYSFTSFTQPGMVFHYDVGSGKSTLFRKSEVAFAPDQFETTQVFYKSKDGTRVPMFITSKKGLRRDGQNPTYLYAYGGFNISLTPAFSPAHVAWMEMGGIFAEPNLRGGGEYGETWHEAGTKLKKQNVFDDFIAAAEFLIAEGYTSSKKLAIAGGSNGGLLVGACMTQRPELFGAALPAVGVMDMLRFHRFTIGWAWTSDYGSALDAKEFTALRAYSPLHNLKKGTQYPPTLITTADHDDRVVPGHSFKFAAALQAAQTGTNPTMIRIETKAGHGAGKPTSKVIDETADKYAFLVKVLGMKVR